MDRKRKATDDQYELDSDGDGAAPAPKAARRQPGKKAPGELSAADTRALAKLHEAALTQTDEELLASVWIKGAVLTVFAEQRPSLQPRTGVWSKDEIQLLKDAVADHCSTRGITEADFARIIHGYPTDDTAGGRRSGDDKTIYRAIALRVPRRPISAVRDRLRRDYHPHSGAAAWTAETDERLTELVGEKGKKWKAIGEIMARRPPDVRDRWENVVSKRDRKVGQWSRDEDAALRTAVTEIAAETDLKADVPDFPWPRVAEALDNKRTRLQCRERWISALKGGDGFGGHTETPVKRQPAKAKRPAPTKDVSSLDPTLGSAIPVLPPTPAPAFNQADNILLLCLMQGTGARTLASVDWQLVSRSLNSSHWTADQCCDHFLALDASYYRRYVSPRQSVLDRFLQPGECDPANLDLQAVLAELRGPIETGLTL